MSEPLDSLVRGWKQHFAAADSQIKWLHSELELEAELAPGIWLVGCVDAVGESGGELFFGEWKTANPRERKTWKQVWRMNPQSLSYGVLLQSKYPAAERFTVRKAFKELTPSYDHAWFRYSKEELLDWQLQLIHMTFEIRAYQKQMRGETQTLQEHWPTNWSRCFRYGTSYACPFFECACNKLDWRGIPPGAGLKDATWSYWGQRARVLERDPSAIILSPTTVADWLDCREMYRRKYVELVTPPKNDAVVLGGEFHRELGSHYSQMVQKEATDVRGN